MHWNPLALPAAGALLLAILTSTFVLVARPTGIENRRLAVLLVIEGIVVFSMHGGNYFWDSPEVVRVWYWIGTMAIGAKPAAYLLFLATLPTPLSGPLRTRAGELALWLFMPLAACVWIIDPAAFFDGVRPADYASWQPYPGPLIKPLATVLVVVYLLGLLLAFAAHRGARTDIERRRTRDYAVAFVTRDTLFVIWAASYLVWPRDSAHWHTMWNSIALMPLIYIPLVVYGILHTQLFGIELRLKQAITHGTVAIPFAVVFFLVTEGVEQWVSFDSAWLGILAAAAITLAIRPIRRGADRLADALLPHVADSAEYRHHRGEQIYRAALEAVLLDGEVTPAERRVLDRLQRELGIEFARAGVLEAAVRKHVVPGPQVPA